MACSVCGNPLDQTKGYPLMVKRDGKSSVEDGFPCVICGRVCSVDGDEVIHRDTYAIVHWDERRRDFIYKSSLLYPRTWAAIKVALLLRDPDLKPLGAGHQGCVSPAPLGYLLWMIQEMWYMTWEGDGEKFGRWLGWVLAQMEFLDFWDNAHSRDLVRSDVHPLK